MQIKPAIPRPMVGLYQITDFQEDGPQIARNDSKKSHLSTFNT